MKSELLNLGIQLIMTFLIQLDCLKFQTLSCPMSYLLSHSFTFAEWSMSPQCGKGNVKTSCKGYTH